MNNNTIRLSKIDDSTPELVFEEKNAHKDEDETDPTQVQTTPLTSPNTTAATETKVKQRWKTVHSGFLLKRGRRWNGNLRHRLFVLQMEDINSTTVRTKIGLKSQYI